MGWQAIPAAPRHLQEDILGFSLSTSASAEGAFQDSAPPQP